MRRLFRVCLVMCHSPQYQEDHRDSLAQGWAHVPVPKARALFDDVADLGEVLATLLDPLSSARAALRQTIGEDATRLARIARVGGGPVRESDLLVKISYYGAAKGRWRERQYQEDEPRHPAWRETTGDLFINDDVLFRNVPSPVWHYELGGYPVLKKWLGYRHWSDRDKKPLSLAEKDLFRQMVQRIAAILRLQARFDELYEQAIANPLLQ